MSQSDTNEQPLPGAQLDDDEYVRRRRLKAILDAREQVERTVARVEENHIQGALRRSEGDRAVIRAVQSYLRQTRLIVEQIDGGKELLEEEQIGVTQLQTPDLAPDECKIRPPQVELAAIDGITRVRADGDRIEWIGTRSVLEASPRFVATFEVSEVTAYEGRSTSTEAVRQTVPRSLAMRALERTEELLDDSPLAIHIQEAETEYEQDYADLYLDE